MPAFYLDLFVHDCAESYHLIPTEHLTVERGLDLTQQHFLRGYDALQLAYGLATNEVLTVARLPALTFVSCEPHPAVYRISLTTGVWYNQVPENTMPCGL